MVLVEFNYFQDKSGYVLWDYPLIAAELLLNGNIIGYWRYKSITTTGLTIYTEWKND